MASSLPFEIITSILLLLPTKILVKFQCVCKAWYDLIRDPVFIKSHFQTRDSKGINGYLVHFPLYPTMPRVFRLLHEKTLELTMDIPIPVEFDTLSLILIGSCNGMLCFSDMNNYANSIYLCNPYIQRVRRILTPAVMDPVENLRNVNANPNVALGFGCCDGTDDFKVVRIKFANELSLNARTPGVGNVEVYSTVTGAWRDLAVDYFPWAMLNVRSEVVIKNSIHWKVIFNDTFEDLVVILSFHIGTERFRQIRLPKNYEAEGENLVEYLGTYKNNLSLFLIPVWEQARNQIQPRCCLWVLNEYGVETSWTRTHSVVVNPIVVSVPAFTKYNEVIYYDGHGDLFIYDFETRESRPIELMTINGVYANVVSYIDTLVLINDE